MSLLPRHKEYEQQIEFHNQGDGVLKIEQTVKCKYWHPTDQNRDQPVGDMIPAALCGGPALVNIALVLLDKTYVVPALALGGPGLVVHSGIELRHDFL